VNFFLLMLFAAALAYLWRRTDQLQSRLSFFEDLVESLRDQLALNGAGSDDIRGTGPDTDRGSKKPLAEAPSPRRPSPETAKTAAKAAVPASPRKVQNQSAAAPSLPAEPEPETIKKPAWRPSFDFEDIFGRLLPIWAGGVTLAVAGFFLVKFSIEQGLLGPQVRVALGFLFGGLLLGGAEIAYRQEHRLADERVRQALAGAGLATLYASFYLAGSLYGLVGSTIAFLGLAGVTGAAILLSFRFGLPSAILGLVGGFAAPMLVGSEEANLPMLALYLALVTGGLTYAGNRQGRSWLALAALAGGFGWGFLILVSGVTGIADILAFGGYIIVVGALVPAFTLASSQANTSQASTSQANTSQACTETRGAAPWLQIGAAALAAVQLAVMVEQAGFSLLAWGLYGLLSAALAFFAWRDARLRPSSAFAAGLGAVMLLFWPHETTAEFTLVAASFIAIFAGVPLANIWRSAQVRVDAYQLSAFSLAMIGVTYFQFENDGMAAVLSLACLAIAMLPALGAFLLWPAGDKSAADKSAEETKIPRTGLVSLSSAAIGTVLAGLIATPVWAAPLVIGMVALGLIGLGWKRADGGLLAICWAGAGAALLSLLSAVSIDAEIYRLGGAEGEVDQLKAILRWLAASMPFIALALRRGQAASATVAEVFGTALAYGLTAQFMPGDTLAWVAAGGAAAMAFAMPDRAAARLTAAAVVLAWAAGPLGQWLFHAGFALGSKPMMIADMLGWKVMALQLMPVLVTGAAMIWRRHRFFAVPMIVEGVAAVTALVMAHLAFKQVLSIESAEQFVTLGLLERTLWQAVLLGAAMGVMRLAGWKAADWKAAARPKLRVLAIALASCSLAHFLLFSFGWHNPLWDGQAVGDWPALNLLIPAYGMAIFAALWLARTIGGAITIPRWIVDTLVMVLIAIFALSELRHVFAGSVLNGTIVDQTEDLLRSLLGIVLAIAFLLWGARSKTRSWRIGSLVLMLGAVFKVFWFDASGLEGLVRIASFVALGFSLIGIGWFYARQLKSQAPPADTPAAAP